MSLKIVQMEEKYKEAKKKVDQAIINYRACEAEFAKIKKEILKLRSNK